MLFESRDGSVTLPVKIDSETVWLSQVQIAQLFGKDRMIIGRHIRNAISDGEIVPETMCAKIAHLADNAAGSVKTEIYNLPQGRLKAHRRSYARRADGDDRRIQAPGEGTDGQSRYDVFEVRNPLFENSKVPWWQNLTSDQNVNNCDGKDAVLYGDSGIGTDVALIILKTKEKDNHNGHTKSDDNN